MIDRETGIISFEDVMLEKDEGNRADTTIEGLSSLKPIKDDGFITVKGKVSKKYE